jgi:hypothetical protein
MYHSNPTSEKETRVKFREGSSTVKGNKFLNYNLERSMLRFFFYPSFYIGSINGQRLNPNRQRLFVGDDIFKATVSLQPQLLNVCVKHLSVPRF